MPVHHFANDSFLQDKGLVNYWGYNTIGFFAPDHKYSSSTSPGGQVQEFKTMVRALHEAGIEVILDVVYNHTAEGNHLGPTLSFRGIDNQAYYRLVDDDPQYYMDYTGTGNTLNVRHPHSLQLIMDSLRYWVTEMHVDGFRFDLAASLAREFYDVDRLSSFFELVQQDPVVSQVKLIAEPWDVGQGGYQVGNFPPQWTEWNGKYRDTVRDFWRGEPGTVGEFAARLTGSADLYETSGRRPGREHQLRHRARRLHPARPRLLQREAQRGQPRRQQRRREPQPLVELRRRGRRPTTPAVNELRNRQQRNLIATLFLSQGVPMICHGDELGRTQRRQQQRLLPGQRAHLDRLERPSTPACVAFTEKVAKLRHDHPVFRRRRFFDGRPTRRGGGVPDIAWFTPEGTEMTEEDWESGFGRSIAVYLNGKGIPDRDLRGQRVVDDSFLLCFSAHDEPIEFHLPGDRLRPELGGRRSTRSDPDAEPAVHEAGRLARPSARARCWSCSSPPDRLERAR